MDKKAERLLKKAAREQQKRIKPGECEKYIRLVIDGALLMMDIGQELLSELQHHKLQYEIRDLPESNCLIWERLQPADVVDSEKWQMENQVFRVVSQTELHRALKSSTLNRIARSLKEAFPQLKHTVLIARDRITKTTNASLALVSLQVEEEVSVVQVESGAKELALLLKRYTKSIAEVPYKQQKSQSLWAFKKFVANDKKQCVRVEGCNGLARLWQQHLNRLPMVTLGVSETIMSQYSCPKRLIDEYATNPNGENALADLRIQRGGPTPLATDRRIGKVLSGKLYRLYTTKDPNTTL